MPPIGIQTSILLFLSVLSVLIGLRVLINNPKHIVNRSFFVFVSGAGIWAAGIVLLLTTQNFIFDKMTLYGGILMFLGLTLFARTFPDQKRISNAFRIGLLPFAIIALAIPFNVFIKGMQPQEPGSLVLEPINGPGMPFLAITLLSYTVLSIFYLFKNYRKSRGRERLQFRYLFLGIVILIGSTVVFSVLLPALGIFRLNLLGPASVLLFTGLTAYAIIKHELLDIKVLVQRGLIYTILLFLIIGLYLLFIFLLGFIVEQNTEVQAFVAAGVTLIFGIFSVPTIEHFFRTVTDKIFFKNKYTYSDVVDRLSKTLHNDLNFDTIVADISEELKNAFRTESLSFGFYPEHHLAKISTPLKSLPGDEVISVPIIIKSSAVGYLTSGKKLSGDYYTSKDIDLLTTLSYQSAIALERAQLFQEVKEYAEHLEDKVKRRTQEIQNLQEGQNKMMIDISHGLQTPLTVMRGRLELLKEHLPKNQSEIIETSIDDISTLIRNLLNLARLEKLETLDFVEVPLSDLIKEVIEYFEVICHEQGITLNYKVQENLSIQGDADRIRELAINLLSNSIKYMGDREPKEIYISLLQREESIVLEVRDTGIGIPNDHLPHIFNRFYRVKNPRARVGSGLGLSIVKEITAKHNATITAESSSSDGTIFKVMFPYNKKQP